MLSRLGLRCPVLAVCAFALICGEACAFACSWLSAAWPWFAAALATAALAWWGERGRLPTVAVFFAVGAVLAFRTDARLAEVLAEDEGVRDCGRTFDLEVEDEAVVRLRRDGRKVAVFHSHCGPMPLRVSVPVLHGADIPQPGETWRCSGWLSYKTFHDNRFGTRFFSVPPCMKAERIRAASRWNACRFYRRCRDVLASCVGLGLEWNSRLAGLVRAILLGCRTEMNAEDRETFVAAGTVHVFAISGLHVMVVVLAMRRLLSMLGVPESVNGLVALPLVAAYAVLVGARPSVVRAVVMASFWMMADAFGRRRSPLGAWSATAIVVYALRPERLFDVGCTFSFTVMLGIVAWMGWTRRFDPLFATMEEDPGWRFRPGWMVKMLAVARKLRSLAGISFAAWVAGVPVAAHLLGRFTPGGLVSNMAVVLLATVAVEAGAAGMAFSFLCLPLAAICNNLSAAAVAGMVAMSRWTASLPFADFAVEKWPLHVCALWYAGMAAATVAVGRLFLRSRGNAPRRWWKRRNDNGT